MRMRKGIVYLTAFVVAILALAFVSLSIVSSQSDVTPPVIPPADCTPTEPGVELTCNDGLDNDCDSLTDCADSDCNTNAACSTGPTIPADPSNLNAVLSTITPAVDA